MALVAEVNMITRYIALTTSEEKDFHQKLEMEQLPFSWTPPRAVSESIVAALAAAGRTGRKRALTDEPVKLPISGSVLTLLELQLPDPKLPPEQTFSMMLGQAAICRVADLGLATCVAQVLQAPHVGELPVAWSSLTARAELIQGEARARQVQELDITIAALQQQLHRSNAELAHLVASRASIVALVN